MRSTLDVEFILQLFCVIAILTVAVDGNNASPGSKTTPAPAKKSENTIIVNVDHDSHNTEKAIKSLEATLEKNFQKLIRVVNGTSRGKPNIESGIKLTHLFDFLCLCLAKLYCILSWTSLSFALC